jgi:endonuclease/exonuclease/phosphatase family metal-dependent hydrolase
MKKILLLLVACVLALDNNSMQLQLALLDSSLHQLKRALKYQETPISTIWEEIARNINLTRKQKIDLFIRDSKRLASENAKIPVHEINNNTVRIATYNIHFWSNPWTDPNYSEIMQTIKEINADILMLQEVSWGPTTYNKKTGIKILEQQFKDLGYKYGGLSSFCHGASYFGAPFGNIIFSKYPFIADPVNKSFRKNRNRCFTTATIKLPNNKIVSVYSTHLEVFDTDESIRLEQITELIQFIEQTGQKNVLIGGDFNSIRKLDYEYYTHGKYVWDLLLAENRRLNFQTQQKALNALSKAGFTDSFTHANLPRPKFTVWSGLVVDFIFLSKHWDIPIDGCYIFYTAASDHLPVIVDLKV